MEQMTVCEYCGTEIPHVSASWADDGSSYCEGCHPCGAQAEIARLQKEVERLTYDLEWMTTDRGKWQDSATRRYFERDAAHNDAIEAAAMVQVLRINEGGRRYMSGLSPEARAAIRALKITTQDQPK